MLTWFVFSRAATHRRFSVAVMPVVVVVANCPDDGGRGNKSISSPHRSSSLEVKRSPMSATTFISGHAPRAPKKWPQSSGPGSISPSTFSAPSAAWYVCSASKASLISYTLTFCYSRGGRIYIYIDISTTAVPGWLAGRGMG